MSIERLILYSLPTLLLGILIGRILADHLTAISKISRTFPVGIVLGVALACLHFFLLREYSKDMVTDSVVLGIDPKFIVCTIVTGGIFLLDMDLLINSRFRKRKRMQK